MNRNWDIMRNAANGADPYGNTSRMDQTRMRERERWTSRDREENDYLEQQHPHQHPQQYPQQYPQHYRAHGAQSYGGYGYGHERGTLGRMEDGIDRAFGNDWARQERYRGARPMHERDDDQPTIWDRVKGAFTGGTFSGKGPKNYARSDERIREDVCECLTYHPNVDASEIDVAVKGGEVTLTGTVHDRMSKRLAEDIVEEVRGVRDVHNQLRLVTNQARNQVRS